MYRPHLDDTCCPPFTIRLDARAFTPTKSQRKVERRWRRYLDGELDDDGKLSVEDEGEGDASRGGARQKRADARGVSASASDDDRDAVATDEMRDAGAVVSRTKKTTTTTKKKKRAFEIREAPSAFDEEEYRLWRRYQASVHGDDENSLSKLSYRRFLVDTPLRLREAPVAEPEDDEAQGGWVEWPGYPRTERAPAKTRNARGANAANAPRAVPPPARFRVVSPPVPGGRAAHRRGSRGRAPQVPEQQVLLLGALLRVGVAGQARRAQGDRVGARRLADVRFAAVLLPRVLHPRVPQDAVQG